jgi:hypothetical protein
MLQKLVQSTMFQRIRSLIVSADGVRQRMFQPKCTIARGWTDRRGCLRPAVHRNRFGGFECQEHIDLHNQVVAAHPDWKEQPDSFFNPGVLVSKIDGDTFLGKLHLMIAYFIYKRFGKKIGVQRRK